MKNSELCVPMAALTESTETPGESVAPESGDEVQVTIRGRVTRSEGGNVYLQPLSGNGWPLASGGEKSLEEEGEALEREMAGGGGGSGAYGLLGLLALGALCLLGGAAYAADVEWARNRTASGGRISNMVFHATPQQVNSVEIDYYGTGTRYLMVFDSATNQLAGAIPHFPAIQITNNVVGKDWGASGAPFYFGVNVCLSTTPNSLTNATDGGNATVISSPKTK